ncbi:hypothetical protein VC83_07737, partial [Pseudogymnoascus destructans]
MNLKGTELVLHSDSGFSNSQLALQWLEHFAKHTASEDTKVLLLDSHLKRAEVEARRAERLRKKRVKALLRAGNPIPLEDRDPIRDLEAAESGCGSESGSERGRGRECGSERGSDEHGSSHRPVRTGRHLWRLALARRLLESRLRGPNQRETVLCALYFRSSAPSIDYVVLVKPNRRVEQCQETCGALVDTGELGGFGGGLPQDMQAKMRAFHLSRQGTPPGGRPSASPADENGGNMAGGLRLPMGNRPQLPQGLVSAPAVPRQGGKPSLSERRNMPKLGGLPGSPAAPAASPSLSLNGSANPAANNTDRGSMFNKFSNYVDTEKGTLRFAGKAVIHGQGIDFSSGNNFSISLDEVDTLEELGKGNYGTVYKVRHARPRQQRLGLGLQVRSLAPNASIGDNGDSSDTPLAKNSTGVIMAMKEIRLELDEAKFAAIIMELDILHRC